MDFKTMSKQRKFILCASIAGLISMFLPWLSVSILGMSQSSNGMHGWGILAFFCFVISGLLSLYGNQKVNLDKTSWMLALILGIVPLIIVVSYYSQMANSFLGADFIGFGIYITALAAIGVMVSAWLFRSPTDSLKDGFDSLKKSVEQKIASANAAPPATPPPPADTTQPAPPAEGLV